MDTETRRQKLNIMSQFSRDLDRISKTLAKNETDGYLLPTHYRRARQLLARGMRNVRSKRIKGVLESCKLIGPLLFGYVYGREADFVTDGVLNTGLLVLGAVGLSMIVIAIVLFALGYD